VRSRRLSILCLLLSLTPCEGAQPLRTLAEVQALSDEAARAGREVRVEALVLYSDPANTATILHDGTAACFNSLYASGLDPAKFPQAGDRVAVEGFTKLFGVTPHIEARTLTVLGRGVIPEPRPLAADEIYQSLIDVAWIEVPAVVVGVETGGIAFTGACITLRFRMIRPPPGFPGMIRGPYGPAVIAVARVRRSRNRGISFPA
jgi:hypothetical protein